MSSAPRPIRPVQGFAPELLLAAQGVRAVLFDVEGCLTDGRIYIGENGESVKAFSAVVHHVSPYQGGHGGARECCDLLLTAAGRYAELLSSHRSTLDDGQPA